MRPRVVMVPTLALALVACAGEPSKGERERDEARSLIRAMENHPTLQQAERKGPEKVTLPEGVSSDMSGHAGHGQPSGGGHGKGHGQEH